MVTAYTLRNQRGSRVRLIDYGATIVELRVPDRWGRQADVVLGFDSLERYEQAGPYFGCVVGRVANRIAGASFELDGRTHTLAANEGANHLHGGVRGFDKQLFSVQDASTESGPALRFGLVSADADEGYPGRLELDLTIRLSHDDALTLDYRAVTDAPTLVNLTHHDYWNLAGTGDVVDHVLQLDAEYTTEVDAALLPTGRLLPVAGGPLDFRETRPIGRFLDRFPSAYDHNFVLAATERPGLRRVGELRDPGSGRRMTISTTEPGLQVYTGNSLAGVHGKRGTVHDRHAGICLEAQGFPDAIHHADFPSIVLRPGETYRQTTEYRFHCDGRVDPEP